MRLIKSLVRDRFSAFEVLLVVLATAFASTNLLVSLLIIVTVAVGSVFNFCVQQAIKNIENKNLKE